MMDIYMNRFGEQVEESPEELSSSAKTASATEVAALLREFGRRSALAGGNPFRAKAYQRAADSLATQTEPLERLIAEHRLQDIPGIGAAIAGMIERMAETGT